MYLPSLNLRTPQCAQLPSKKRNQMTKNDKIISSFFQTVRDSKYLFHHVLDYMNHEDEFNVLNSLNHEYLYEFTIEERSTKGFDISRKDTYKFKRLYISSFAKSIRCCFHDFSSLTSTQMVEIFLSKRNQPLLLPGYIHVNNRIKFNNSLMQFKTNTSVKEHLQSQIFENNEEFKKMSLNILKALTIHDLFAPLRHGVDLDTQDTSGLSILHHAIIREHLKLIKFLIKNGATINLKTYSGYSPLHLSVKKENIQITEYLLKNGADVNQVDNDGNSPLHNAAKIDNLEIIQCLIYYGANPLLKNRNGKTPSNLAASYSLFKNFELLIERRFINTKIKVNQKKFYSDNLF